MGSIISSNTKNNSEYTTDGNVNSTPGERDFGYIEFDGSDGKTCPTCQGTGRISRRQEDELVALIPYHDKRLKPRRTTMYVMLAIIVCLIICGLILFFILPRSVKITEGKIANYSVNINTNLSSTVIIATNQYNITNTNYFHVQITKISVEAFFDQVQVGTGKLKHGPVVVPPLTNNFPVNITVQMTFDKTNQLDFMSSLCTNDKRRVHDIVIKFQATQTSKYLSHTEQDTISSYKYIDCSPTPPPPKAKNKKS
uniref:transmembrane protein 106B-like n=1 Tax=Styela clava TaxID=7725 RepID=UPI00193AA263|nr:transmembrane protein 106B-like [Styela clava]